MTHADAIKAIAIRAIRRKPTKCGHDWGNMSLVRAEHSEGDYESPHGRQYRDRVDMWFLCRECRQTMKAVSLT